MQQNPVGDNLQVYASLSTLKVEPPQNEMTKGVVPLDTLPAGWWNWLWNAITQAQNNAQYSLDTVYQEINAVLTHAGITPDPTQFDQLKQAIIKLRTQIATAIDVGSVLSTETGTNGSVKVAPDGKMTVNGFGDLQQLQTLMKDTLVEAINEVFNVASVLDGEVGDLTTLATENKTTIVSAINELKEASGEGAAALEGKIGNMDNLQTSAKDTLVSAINEVNDKEITLSGQISPRFTYVVDSDQALKDWANNVPGNDYTAVLIRRGTWTSDISVPIQFMGRENLAGVNLTTTETKVVVGEPESKLVFSNAMIGLGYESVPTTQDYWMRDVNIGNTSIGGIGFYLCVNLIHCICTAMYNAFLSCANMMQCTGTVIGTGDGGPGDTGYVFAQCNNLSNCIGNGISSTGNMAGFYGCNNLINCIGSATGIVGYGFASCKGASNCKEGDTPCTTALFYQSYASLVVDERFLCGGTADGGFNGNDVSSSAITPTPSFTYVVDSDQALLDWANNVDGNNYSAVLIRRGTWASTKGVNLRIAGTKVVVGEAGSKLAFNANGLIYGLYYSYLTPDTGDYWMRDVTVECTGTYAGCGFQRCTNLINCTSTGTATSSNTDGTGFEDCTNLVNCTGIGIGTNTGGASGNGFEGCTNLINCTGIGTGPDASAGNSEGNGFLECTNLINCTGTGTGNNYGRGFHACTSLTNCKGTGTGNNYGRGYGFHACTSLTNCRGTGTSAEDITGYGFYECKRVTGCKKGVTCTTGVFYQSYADFYSTSTYVCDDTPNGGFNDTTN